MKNFIVYYLATIMLYGGWAFAASCENNVFSGVWRGNLHIGTATMVINGNNVMGHYDTIHRLPFKGTLLEGGCQVDMIFPDDAFYRGTIKDNGCKIQWSYPNSPNTINPNNYWFIEDCDSNGVKLLATDVVLKATLNKTGVDLRLTNSSQEGTAELIILRGKKLDNGGTKLNQVCNFPAKGNGGSSYLCSDSLIGDDYRVLEIQYDGNMIVYKEVVPKDE